MKRFHTVFVICFVLSCWLNVANAQVRIPEPVPPSPAIREAFDLDPFYQQWIDVEGFPVIASAKVNPYAVKEAAWIVRQMIGHRPDILKVQADHQERLSVLAIDESMSNLPEYERVPGNARIWIAYTRDIVCGPCQATLAAEENLLFPDSSYPHFLIHEFAHTIHGGLRRLGPEFDDRLKTAYNAAMKKGLWRGYYAASNRDEYWAEGANSWFHSTQTNAVNTRAALKKYDPGLARLLTEIFGDGDWRYTPPATRTHLPHLQGFDPEDSPRYDGSLPWEIDARKLDKQLEDPNSDGEGKWVNLKLYPPRQLPSLLRSTTRGKDTVIFYVNPTGQEISFYTVDADGTENLRYHATRNIFDFGTYAGAIWLIKDHTGEDLAVFRAEEKTGRIIIGTGPRTNGTVLETGRIIIGTGPPTTGTEIAIDNPPELSRSNFTIGPGEFAILVHNGQHADINRANFKTYDSYFTLGKDSRNVDIPNLAHFFQNGGRIELISHITGNPLPRHSSEAQFGDIVISEIMWGLDGTSPTRQYIELYNASAHTYTFTDADVSLRFSTVSEEPLPEGAFPPLHNSDVRVKVIDRVSNKGWKVPGRSGNTSQNKPLISIYRTIDYTTGDVPDGTLASSWKTSTGRVNLPAPSYGTPGAKHLLPVPVVHVESSDHSPMYWINMRSGTLHRLVGAKAENLVPSVRNATDLAMDVAGGKLYWTAQNPTNNQRGTLNSANLDGSDVRQLRDLFGAPLNVTIDAAGGKLYWMDTLGRIQRSNLDGSGIENVVRGLTTPGGIAIANGRVYWTEASGRVRRANLDGSNIQDLPAGPGAPMNMAVSKSTLYWTVKTGEDRGEIRFANLSGTPNVATYAEFNQDFPIGIAVDPVAEKLYWTTSGGKIGRGSIDESSFQPNFGTGFNAPGALVLSVEPPLVVEPPEAATTDAVVSLLPSPVDSPAIGEQLTLNLSISAGEAVAGYQVTVRFDPTALRYVESSNGDYLPTGAFFVQPVVNRNRVELASTALAGVSDGDGTLATITFEVLTVKASTLTLSETLLSDSEGNTFLPQTEVGEITEPPKLKGDVNGDSVVNIQDLVLVASSFGEMGENAADVNADGVVNIADLVLVAGSIGTAAGAPSLHPSALGMFTAADVQGWLSQAHQLDSSRVDYQRGVLVLEHLLAVLRPKETTLLPNYPNPFNPETWIPYHLANPSAVRITIYDTLGTVVRRLELGHQREGYYTSQSRAAYWDGRNTLGEPVASGVYFYTLTAGNFAQTRRMLILK